MKFREGCSKRRRVGLVLATIWLSGCATVGLETVGLAACPPVVKYSREFQTQAGYSISEMLSGYAVIRGQA